MITTNVFSRIFYLKYKQSTGTCFTLDIDMRQYVVTARHVVDGITNGDAVGIFYKGEWHHGNASVVGVGSGDDIRDDVAVLSMNQRISPSLPLEATSANLVVGQDVFFLGFPYGLLTDTDVMRGFPMPLVKKATISGFVSEKERPEIFLLDGHNNPGFSGGPVVFTQVGRATPEYKVMAVVSGYRAQEGDVFYNGKPTGLKHSENAGIIFAPSIKRVTEIISTNPIGVGLDGASG